MSKALKKARFTLRGTLVADLQLEGFDAPAAGNEAQNKKELYAIHTPSECVCVCVCERELHETFRGECVCACMT